ncbi:MAG: RraA family protein, partial [Leeuwenhoekiella sp.]
MNNLKNILIVICFFAFDHAISQGVTSTPEQIKALTSNWSGERFEDGRPKVSDALLKRMQNIQIEEAWGFLRGKGYNNQFDGDWEIIHPDKAMTGRVVTAQYMPLRPDYQ